MPTTPLSALRAQRYLGVWEIKIEIDRNESLKCDYLFLGAGNTGGASHRADDAMHSFLVIVGQRSEPV